MLNTQRRNMRAASAGDTVPTGTHSSLRSRWVRSESSPSITIHLMTMTCWIGYWRIRSSDSGRPAQRWPAARVQYSDSDLAAALEDAGGLCGESVEQNTT